MTKKKGFQQKKQLTKGQIQEQQGTQLENNAKQLQAVTQMVVQSSQHLQQMQREVGTMANLLRYTEKQEAADWGDFVIIDCLGRTYLEDGSLNPEPFDGGTLFGFAVELLDDSNFVPGFVEELIGKSAGDAFNMDITFPEEYHAENLQGQKTNFEVSVLKVLTPSELNSRIFNLKRELEAEVAASKKEAQEAKEGENSGDEEGESPVKEVK